MNIKTATIRCDDNAEAVVFSRYEYVDGTVDYEINIEDSYCCGEYKGIKDRFVRAINAFFAKPICYTGIAVENPERIKKFLKECEKILDEKEVVKNNV